MGCAAAYQLSAREGRRVLLLEQFALGHDRGSSHGPSRIMPVTNSRMIRDGPCELPGSYQRKLFEQQHTPALPGELVGGRAPHHTAADDDDIRCAIIHCISALRGLSRVPL